MDGRAIPDQDIIPEQDAGHFRAFVSYSHADAALAKKLHRKMESYKLPKLLRGMQSGGQKDGRLGRLFRDREDLPATLDLSESVKSALAQSQALIVLCSPNAKNSLWVAKEIELFRELHPDRPILAALAEGEPEDAFPEALTLAGEPLAADLRKEGDGWRLGLLKLVAGIAEVPLDALVQRDAQRQFRSVMSVTLVVGVALLAMTGMTIYALQQRNEAQFQQAQAEGLVEYMLTDLRDELRGVGRLDVMTDVNERAMDYYKERGDLSDLPVESLERRARILHAMGEDDEKRGDLRLALEKFTEAHSVTEALLAREPENPDRIFTHAQSEYWIGYIAYLQNNWDETAMRWQSYQSLAQKLIAIENDNPNWFQEVGYAHGNLCTLQLTEYGTAKAAEKHCNAALNAVKKAHKIAPSDNLILEALINRHGWSADVYVAQHNTNKAWKLRRIQSDLVDQYAARAGAENRLAIELKLRVLIPQIKLAANRSDVDATILETEALEKIAILEGTDEKNIVWKSYKKMFNQN